MVSPSEILFNKRKSLLNKRVKNSTQVLCIEDSESEEIQTIPSEGMRERGKRGRPETHQIEKQEITVRDDMREFLLHNSKDIQVLFDRVAQKNPAKALDIYKDMAEFVIPRLQRSDSKIERAAPIQVIFQTNSQNILNVSNIQIPDDKPTDD
jgi:hypothetical protein